MRRMGLPSRGAAAPSRILDRLGLVAVFLMVLGPLLAWLRLVPALAGFVTFGLGGLAALVVAILAVIRALRGRGLGSGGTAAAAIAALVFVGLAVGGGRTPMINDFTTDTVDPPVFKQAATLPQNAGRDLAYPRSFAEVQASCCADLQPVRVPLDPPAALTLVEAVASGMPRWTITRRDPQAGELEAVATSQLFGFQDDVILRVRPDASGGSRVDMRSKSRDGKGDRGVNAARIRAFETALASRAVTGSR
jgi:uncharacterized protein (DUF1499 family)